MFDPPGFKENCPYCKSSEMEYYGYASGGFHFYYRCSTCRKYTEYHISSKNFLVGSSIIFLMMVFSITLTLLIFNISPLAAMLFFLVSIALFLIVIFKCEDYFFESVVTDDLQVDLLTIHDPSNKIRLTIIAIYFILFVLFLAYIGIFILNLVGQS